MNQLINQMGKYLAWSIVTTLIQFIFQSRSLFLKINNYGI